jgi:hypothetical protein
MQRDRLGLSSHIRTFSGTCELSILDVHDVSGIINDSHAFLGRDDIEALLKEVLERPTPDKLAYSSALPCAMFTAPEHAVGHFIYICSSALTLSNGWYAEQRKHDFISADGPPCLDALQ